MENESNETEPSLEDWKVRALLAEKILHAIRTSNICSGDCYYTDSRSCGNCEEDLDDHDDLQERIYEIAAEAVGDDDFSLNDMPVPEDIARRESDKPLIQGTDRVLYAGVRSEYTDNPVFVLVAVRSDMPRMEVEQAVTQAWDAMFDEVGAKRQHCIVSSCSPHSPVRSVGGRIDGDLRRRVLLEAPMSHAPVVVHESPPPRPATTAPVDLLYGRTAAEPCLGGPPY